MIQSTSNISSYTRPDAVTNSTNKNTSSVPKLESVESDSVSSSNTQALREALKNTPEIRPEVVEKGRLLAADSTYPPLEIIQGLAKLLAESRDPSEQA